jgi:prolyl tripeptidyl peptidase. Serine peptidase. MEROPS family S09B
MENHDLSDKSNNLAYTVENNLFVQTPDGKKYDVTSDTDKGIVNGQSVHRNELE